MFSKKLIDNAMTYESFLELTENLLSEGKTTGENHTPAYIEYTRLNLSRMNRLDKKSTLSETLLDQIHRVEKRQYWIVLVEAWCGDVAQNLPTIAKIADANPMIDLKLILRDENPEIMDAYLTNGGRSIPKLIILDENLNPIASWGPRPMPIQQMLIEYKEKGQSYQEYAEKAHKWYAVDKTQTLQNEFVSLIDSMYNQSKSKAA